MSMKHSLLIVLALILVVAGVVFWYTNRPTVDTPAPVTGDATTTPASTVPALPTYTGLPEAEAEAAAAQNGVPFRVVERDGEALPVTEDLVNGRVNAIVVDGIVTDFTVEVVEELPPSLPEEATDPSTPETGSHDQIIGLTESEATVYAAEKGVPFRVGMRDGEAQALTMDLRPGRITATIEGGVVTSYTVE